MIIARGLGLGTDEYGILVTGGYGLNPIPIITTGGGGMHQQRRYWDDTEMRRTKEDEELIMILAGWLA